MSDGGKVEEGVAAEAVPRDEAADESVAPTSAVEPGAEETDGAPAGNSTPAETVTPTAVEGEEPGTAKDGAAVESAELDIPTGPLSDEQKATIRRQVTFYFCDSNLVKDDFLKDKISKDSEGYVSLALLMSFLRMREILKIPKEVKEEGFPEALIKNVAEELRTCDSIVVNEDGTKVRRKEVLGDVADVRKAIQERSLCVSKLPVDATLEELEEFFGQHVEFNCVWMLKGKEKKFKGKVFLECKSADVAKEFLGKTVEYKGTSLEMTWKSSATGRKGDQKRKREQQEDAQAGRGRGRGRGRNRGRGRGRGQGRRNDRGGRKGKQQDNDGGDDSNMQVDDQPGEPAAAAPQNGAENAEKDGKRKLEEGEGPAQEAKKAKTDAPVEANGTAQE